MVETQYILFICNFNIGPLDMSPMVIATFLVLFEV